MAKQTDATLREVGDAAKTIQAQVVVLTKELETVSQTAALEMHATSRELRVTAEVLDRTLSRYRDPRALTFRSKPDLRAWWCGSPRVGWRPAASSPR